MDEMSKLREWRDDAPTPDRARLAPGRRRLLDAAGRRRRRLPLLGDWRVVSGAVAAGVTAVALLSVNLGGDPGGDEGVAAAEGGSVVATGTPVQQDAPELLRLAAAEVVDDPVPRPEVGDWVYTREIEMEIGNPADESPSPSEQWFKYADPEFEDWNEGDDHSPRERFEYLAALPEDPDGVLQKARWFYPESGGRPDSEDPGAGRSDEELADWNFGALRVLLGSSPMHPVGQSRAYEAMATVPGLRVADTTVEDAAGRQALAFFLDSDGKGGEDEFRDELLIDPETYAYLGTRYVATENTEEADSWPRAKKGEVVISTAVVSAGLVDREGVRP
ncbi:CU044_5270 family protein [Streptomyces sp. WMMC500]|uniref:CU044_5270 family protein n=1 Tax=Streptomyces sp. WMMC500 TaxID=3015154 RepID=UPI00248B84F8|nr:CU044_5270 family protein [Streptomyces sp. WMMC500]WBB60073.1 CU044_5270 family protein [Streptomyces sp. WMMC500]